ncbi:hypothetical protein D3C84_568550 [compost metagenome]
MRKLWTVQEKELLKIHYPDNRTEDILYLFPDRSLGKLLQHASVLGLKKSEAFFKSPQSGRISKENDIGVSTRYYKNCPGWNKGKKQSDYMSVESIEKTKAGRFKIGQDPHNTVTIGHERISRDGYLEVKVKHEKGNGKNKNFVAKHRLIYEEHFGPIPNNMNVEFIDGDKFNFEPSNLILRSKKENLLNNTMCDTSIVKRFLGVREPKIVEMVIKEMPNIIELKRKSITLNKKINKHAKSTK